MDSFRKDEECQFFDAPEYILSVADEKSDGTVPLDANFNCNTGIFNRLEYEAWIHRPRSVKERRIKFMKSMGLSLDGIALENSLDACSIEREEEVDRIKDIYEAVTRTSSFEEVQEEFCSSRSSMSCCTTLNSSKELCLMENLLCEEGILDEGIHLNGDQEEQCGKVSDDGRGESSDQLVVAEEHGDFESSAVASPSSQHMMGKTHVSLGIMERARRRWISTLRSITCMLDKHRKADDGREDGCFEYSGHGVQKVNVHQCKKHIKELSALYTGQEIQAHEGSIITMKFSPDGRYLASAGEDGIIQLRQVVEDQRCDEIDIPEIDQSCIYFTVNHISELTPLFMDKEKTSKMKGLKKTSDSACVIFPPKVFRLLEKPLHVFCGHTGDIVDLSWSKNNHLLSSSVDKTVRLWCVGYDNCLKIFPHNNYVTCVQFNPVDDNYFISGSIDGKVRIWSIHEGRVVNWTDIREIVTAVCYRPDGQGGIIGSITGSCRFFGISENNMQLDAQLCLLGKKKSQCGGITGFQFLPQDSSKVMVTCADSQVRILDGLNVTSKYKSIGGGSQMSAYFTSDGKHILSASEDSNVYLWNVSQEGSSPHKVNKIKSSERFLANASVAVPWCGLKSQNNEIEHQLNVLEQRLPQSLCLSPPASFSLSEEFFLDSFSKGSATWPEEKLPTSSLKAKTSSIHKSEYKFLESSCKSTSNAHAWGLVIVTATWDGRIRSFHNYGLPVPI